MKLGLKYKVYIILWSNASSLKFLIERGSKDILLALVSTLTYPSFNATTSWYGLSLRSYSLYAVILKTDFSEFLLDIST